MENPGHAHPHFRGQLDGVRLGCRYILLGGSNLGGPAENRIRLDLQCADLSAESLHFHLHRRVGGAVQHGGGDVVLDRGAFRSAFGRVRAGGLVVQCLSLIHISEPTRPY